jgi:Ca-activated chloride channel family protein
MSWANPEYFWFLLIIPLFLAYRVWTYFSASSARLTFSSVDKLSEIKGNYKTWLTYLTPLLYIAAYTFVILSLARPQIQNSTVERSAEGIDIVISIDISSSMLAEDIQPNRLTAAKDVAIDFIQKRISDRIGINVFARESFTVVPPTLDYALVNSLIETIDIGMVRDGTAIGMGLATAINRLRDSETESKVIILLTDGMNNSGEIDPVTAGELASTFGIKVYTIGIGTRGTAPYPIDDPIFGRRYQNVPVEIDEEMLQHIAGITGGRYWRATDLEEFIEVYDEIDQLEQSEVEEIIYIDYEEQYSYYLMGGILFLFMGFLNERFITRSPLLHP